MTSICLIRLASGGLVGWWAGCTSGAINRTICDDVMVNNPTAKDLNINIEQQCVCMCVSSKNCIIM